MNKSDFNFKNVLNQLFGTHSNSTSDAKHKKNNRKRNRTLRIEELESRDLLSATPFDDILHIDSPPDLTAYDQIDNTIGQSADTSEQSGPQRAGGGVLEGPLGTVTSRLYKGSGNYGIGNYAWAGGVFSFTLAHDGDAGSYVELGTVDTNIS